MTAYLKIVKPLRGDILVAKETAFISPSSVGAIHSNSQSTIFNMK
jgi:hypothetical protein